MKTFVIEVKYQDRGSEKTGMVFWLGVQSPSDRDGSPYWITKNVKTIDQLSKIVDGLKSELDGIVDDAKGLSSIEKEKISSGQEIEPGMEPEKIWEIISQSPEEEFIPAFNALTEKDRKAVANYVLTEENIFKGRAMIFSQCFDYRNHILVEV